MENQEAKALLEKYRNNRCTEEELAILESWYNKYELTNLANLNDADWNNINATTAPAVKNEIKLWLRIAGIAAAVIGMAVCIYFFTTPPHADSSLSSGANAKDLNDILPGGNRATLTAANGNTINLSEKQTGVAIDATGLAYNDGTKIDPSKLGMTNEAAGVQLTLTAPRGGQYHITLPDGTNVWVNAGSTLCFPSSFEDLPERRVLLIGEAYFEVAQAKKLFGMKKRARKVPFIVKTASQEVMVLGTHFNINAYPDEKETKTTLLEGSVGITAPLSQADQTILKPNDQAVNNGSEIKVRKVDIEEAVAWKNGYFQFDEASIETVMKQLSRWYNIEVFYQGKIPKSKFYGQLPRKITLQKALDVLRLTDIHYKIEGRKLTIKSD